MAQPFRVEAILDELSEENVPEARITGNLKKIDRYFASDRLEDILDALDAGAAEGRRMVRGRGGDHPQEIADGLQGHPQAAA